jgi:hypothetical protein
LARGGASNFKGFSSDSMAVAAAPGAAMFWEMIEISEKHGSAA